MKLIKNDYFKQRVVPAFLMALIVITPGMSGCSQKNVKNGSAVEGSTRQSDAGTQRGTIGTGSASRATEIPGDPGNSNFNYLPGNERKVQVSDSDITPAGLNDPNNLLSQRIIYFDYNDSTIRPEYLVLLNTHAQLLAKNPDLKIRLEGHADERGTREYNIALSEQRAQSVKRLMGTQGAKASQITTIGFGEEMPVVVGHNQNSWQKNRRVEIKYKN